MLKQILDVIDPIFGALAGARSHLLVTIRQVRQEIEENN
jgi:hypothetical protein